MSDKHESPHFANLYDMMAKYADVLPVAEVVDFLERLPDRRDFEGLQSISHSVRR